MTARRAVVGTTSYGFRYALRDERSAPPLTAIVDGVAAAGLDAFQICENARPLALTPAGWRDVVAAACDRGVELHVGTMTLDLGILSRYMELAAAIPNPLVRIVLEEAGRGVPTREDIERFLDGAAPRLEAAGMTLAVENHFDIPCRLLAETVGALPSRIAGFCIDSANSLRNWESPERVFELLGPRALQFHLKDYVVHGTNVGFTVTGAPLGEGNLDLAFCAERILRIPDSPRVFLENWVPASGDAAADCAADAEWLRRSALRAREALACPKTARG